MAKHEIEVQASFVLTLTDGPKQDEGEILDELMGELENVTDIYVVNEDDKESAYTVNVISVSGPQENR